MPYKCDGINCQKRHDLVVEMGEPVPTHTSPQCWYVAMCNKNYAAELKLLSHDFITDLMEVAERVRQEVIIPFCGKHNLWFYSGMGSWYFERRDDAGIGSSDWDQYLGEGFVEDPDDPDYAEIYRPPEDYEKIRELLSMVVHGKDELFEYMDCYEQRPAHAEGCTPQKPCENVNNCAFCKMYPPASYYRKRAGEEG